MTDELVIVEGEYVPLGTIRTAGPVAMIQQATDIAAHLADIVESRRLYSLISGKKHVRVEGWTTLGAMLGVLPREVRVEYRPANLESHQAEGYEAYVELVRVNDGAVIGGASAICTRAERNWQSRDEFAVRSMATTRATGKAYRLGFSWIMTLAGYEATPYEEMPEEETPKHQQRPQPRKTNSGNGDLWRVNWAVFHAKAASELGYDHMNHVINTLKQKWPNGKFWNSDGTLTDDPGVDAMWAHLQEHQEAKQEEQEEAASE